MVSGHRKIVPGERGDEHEKTGLREVKIGQHRIDSLERYAGIQEEICLARVAEFVERLDGANGGGADGDHALRLGNLSGRLGVDVKSLCVEFILLDSLRMQRLECAETHVEGDLGCRSTGEAALFENARRKVKTRRGSGHRATLPRKNSLVAFCVSGFIGTADVGRQRNVAVKFDSPPLIIRIETDAPLAMFQALLDNGVEPWGEFDFSSIRKFASRTDKRSPCVAELLGQENLYAAGVARPMANEPRLEDARVVKDQQIALVKIRGKVAKVPVLPGLGGAIQHQHAGAVSFSRRILGNQLLGQFIIKSREIQSFRLPTCAF